MEFHPTALRLNTGRNVLEYIIKSNTYLKIYIPYYICDLILEPVIRQGVDFEFYHIDKIFISEIKELEPNAVVFIY